MSAVLSSKPYFSMIEATKLSYLSGDILLLLSFNNASNISDFLITSGIGSKVFLEGALQTRKWTDNSGQDRYTTEVVLQGYNGSFTMLDNANNSNNAGSMASSNNNDSPFPDQGVFNNDSNKTSETKINDDFEDEIPF